MNFARRILFLASLLFSISAGAKAPLFQKMTIDAGGAKIQGQRYLRPDGRANTGKWIIFNHGLGSNFHEFEYLIPVFMAAGDDCFAFNFRGHGTGEERSLVSDYHEGDYRLEKMAAEDFPAMVREVQLLRSGEKGIIVGHSMGGMNPRGAFALGTVTKEQIEAMILLGSPPHFDSNKTDRNALDLFGLLKFFEVWLYSGSGRSDLQIARTRNRMEFALDLAGLFSVPYWIAKFAVQSAVKTEIRRAFGTIDMEYDENWLDRAMSESIPTDIIRSFADYTRKGYPFKDVTIPVPILHIMGEKDVLVKHEDIAAHAATQSEAAGYWLARVAGVGHLGLVTPRAIAAYRETAFDFLKKEGDLGASHKSYFELSTEACAKRLVNAR